MIPGVIGVGIGGIPTAIFAGFVNFDGGGFGDASWKSEGIVDFDGGAVGNVVVNPFSVAGGESDATGGSACAKFVVL